MPCKETPKIPPVSGAVVKGSELSPAQNTKGTQVDVTPVKITDMPGAMRNMGWEKAALVMEKWQQGNAYQITEDMLEKYNRDPLSIPADICDETTVTMEWALKFERVKNAYDELLNYWFTDGAKRVLVDKLRKQNWTFKSSDTNYSHTLGGTNYTARQLHACSQVQFKKFGSIIDTLDEMYGLIGEASLYLAVVGYVEPLRGKEYTKQYVEGEKVTTRTFRITDIGIYLRDLYEFNGFQPLGVWTKNRTWGKAEIVSIFIAPSGGHGVNFLDYVPSGGHEVNFLDYKNIQEPYSYVFNSDFQAYREKYGKGRDMFIFSDVKWEKPKDGSICIQFELP